MASRLKLNEELSKFCNHVYFQPPQSVNLRYPCIIYKKNRTDQIYASNMTHKVYDEYEITIITKDPDSDLGNKLIERFPMISSNRRFTVDNLYHDVLILYW